MKRKFQPKSKNTKYISTKQHGGKVLVEDDEVYKDENGNILQSDSYSHDDDVMIDENGNHIEVNEGDGGHIVNAQSVASASYDQVKDGDRKNTNKEKVLKFNPKESNSLLQSSGLSWFNTRKHMSPSELITEAIDQTGKIYKKYDKDYANDTYGKNSKQANQLEIDKLPTEEDIYDIVFNAQEVKKKQSGLDFDKNTSQYGGSTYVEKPKKLNPLTQKQIDAKYNSREGRKWLTDSFVKEEYPEVTYITNKLSRPDGIPNYNSITGGIHIPSNSTDTYESDVIAELAHADQNRRMSDIGMINAAVKDVGKNILQGNLSPQQSTYEQRGTLENNAHSIIEPIIAKKYDTFDLRLQLPEYRDEFLKSKLSRKQYGGIPESYDGLNEFPDQPVIVPSGNITMEGIDYPVDAYDADTNEYLETMQPNQDYKFNSKRVLEIPKAQMGGGVDYTEDIPTPYKVKAGDSLSKIANAYGLTVEDLLKTNSDIANKNKIGVGDIINIQPVTIKAKRSLPVDRSAEIADINELPAETTGVENTNTIPTLDVAATNVAPNKTGDILNTAKDIASKINDVSVGKLDQSVGTFGIRELMRQNRSIDLPYRAVAPNRQYNYNEENVSPYLDEIDSAVNQQLQYVNQNSTQGQSILNNIMTGALERKRRVINQVNAQNLQRRGQIDNANVNLLNQQDLQQEKFNSDYIDGVQQTIARQDQAKLQQANYMDALVNNRARRNNMFALENIRNSNYKIDPLTGNINRIATQFNKPITQVDPLLGLSNEAVNDYFDYEGIDPVEEAKKPKAKYGMKFKKKGK